MAFLAIYKWPVTIDKMPLAHLGHCRNQTMWLEAVGILKGMGG